VLTVLAAAAAVKTHISATQSAAQLLRKISKSVFT
jgi:hypothetical protein